MDSKLEKDHVTFQFFQVLNDCVGFAAPLLLNKLIRFLQQGFAEFDGFLFIDCVLWKMIYSIIDAITLFSEKYFVACSGLSQ